MSYNFKTPILFISIVSIFFSCKNDKARHLTNKEATNNEIASNEEINYKNIFKLWLKDTLPGLNKWKDEKEANIIKKEVFIEQDSLSLNIYTCYIANVNNNVKLDGRVSDMVDLLKEYNEPLPKEFTISFLYNVFYYPSSVEQLSYGFIYEIKDIVVEEDSSKTEYDFIRGRLSRKKVIKNGGMDTIHTDFIWQGDSLIKHQRR